MSQFCFFLFFSFLLFFSPLFVSSLGVIAPPKGADKWKKELFFSHKNFPAPLKRDIDQWMKQGYELNEYENCGCHSPKSTNVFVWYHKGSFSYDQMPEKHMRKWKREAGVLNLLARNLVRKYPTLPNIKFIMNLDSKPVTAPCPCSHRGPPILILDKLADMSQMIRFPTPYLGVEWMTMSRQLLRQRKPWGKKISTFCWVGAIDRMPGSKDRVDVLLMAAKLMEKSSKMKKEINVAVITEGQDLEKYYNRSDLTYIKSIPRSRPHPESYFSNCKYNFHMSGHTHGTYSRALQTLLPQLTVPVIYKNTWEEYYYDWLEEGIHYVSFNENNFEETLRELLKNDRKSEKMAENAVSFYQNYLILEPILSYWEWLLLSLAKLQIGERKYATTPKNVSSFAAFRPLSVPPGTRRHPDAFPASDDDSPSSNSSSSSSSSSPLSSTSPSPPSFSSHHPHPVPRKRINISEVRRERREGVELARGREILRMGDVKRRWRERRRPKSGDSWLTKLFGWGKEEGKEGEQREEGKGEQGGGKEEQGGGKEEQGPE